MEIKEKTFKAVIKANSPTNEVVGFDEDKKAYVIKIKAMPKDNKANIELIKFLSKVLGKRVRIKSGFKSKEKVMEISS